MRDGWSPALAIFDCDGVLVDSEMLSAGTLMTMLAEEGFAITEEAFRSDFLGRSFAAASERAHRRFGRPLPEGFEARYRLALLDRIRWDLKPMPGAASLLASLNAPFCLATSSSPQRLAVTLAATGLAEFFEGRSFTSAEVTRGKPAPDLFLHAARCMGVEPDRALVIEDSEMGVRAGLAAGMMVCHFAGGAHVAAGYSLPNEVKPHLTAGSMAELGRLFAKFGLSSKPVSP